jgi:hypothetical protein
VGDIPKLVIEVVSGAEKGQQEARTSMADYLEKIGTCLQQLSEALKTDPKADVHGLCTRLQEYSDDLSERVTAVTADEELGRRLWHLLWEAGNSRTGLQIQGLLLRAEPERRTGFLENWMKLRMSL